MRGARDGVGNNTKAEERSPRDASRWDASIQLSPLPALLPLAQSPPACSPVPLLFLSLPFANKGSSYSTHRCLCLITASKKAPARAWEGEGRIRVMSGCFVIKK